MATGVSDFPTSLDTTSNQPAHSTLASIELDGDGTANNQHSNVHGVHSTAIVQIETKIGTGSSSPSANKVLRATGTGTSAWAQVGLTTDVTGILPVANGGSGASSLTDGGVLLGSGTGAVTAMAVLTDGQMIVGNGSTDPVAESGATLRTSIGLGSVATRDTGISNNNIPIFTSGVADNDFLRVDGTAIEGRSASEVASDIEANIDAVGALASGSIASGFGAINNSANSLTTGALVATTMAPSGRVTIAAGKDILMTAPADNGYTGIVVTLTNNTGSSIAIGKAVALHKSNASEIILAQANADTTMPCIGITAEAIADGASGEVLVSGLVYDADVLDCTIGYPMYVSEDSAGTFTKTLPASDGDRVQIVGQGLHADKMIFNPDYTIVERSG
jgi:hypothetical protein